MPIGTSDGKFYKNLFEQHQDGVVTPPPGDEAMVMHPNVMQTNKDMNTQQADDELFGGTEVAYKRLYVSPERPLETPTEPAGALKPSEGSQTPGDVDWTKYNQPFGELTDTNPEGKTLAEVSPKSPLYPYHQKFTERDINEAMHVALSAGPNPIEGKFHRYIDMFMKQPMPKAVADSYQNVPKGWTEIPSGLTPSQDYGAYKYTKPAGPFEPHTWTGPEGFYKYYPGLKEGSPKTVDFYPNDTQKHGFIYKSMTPEEAVPHMFTNHEDQKIADEVAGKLKEMKQMYEGDKVTIKNMSPEDIEKMKEGWKQQPFNPDTWEDEVKAIADALDKKWESIPEKKQSAKEAFIEGANAIHDKLMTTFANIKSKYIEAIRDPVTTVPNIKKAQEKGYTVPAYKGMVVEDFTGAKPIQKFQNYGEMYSTESPLLAEMYAGFIGHTKAPRPTGHVDESEFAAGAQVVPLLINPKDYHVVDAGGKSWQVVNQKAIDEARKLKKPGVIVQNVWDEPGSTTYLGAPKTVYITLPSGAHTVKSRFAKDFDPSSPNMLHMIPAIGIGGTAGYVAMQPSDQ